MSLPSADEIADLNAMPSLVFAALVRAVSDSADPLRTPSLATVLQGRPMVRTVVLRRVEESSRSVWCFSDVRAEKVRALRENPFAAWCFYDPATKRQVRLEGRSTIECGAAEAETFWAATPDSARRNYGMDASPGAKIAMPSEIRWTGPGFDRFAVIKAEIAEIDFLELRPEVHHRARAHWTGDSWTTSWIAP